MRNGRARPDGKDVTSPLAPFALLCVVFSLPAAALAAPPEYTTAKKLATVHNLRFVDLSEGSIHACKLVGTGHEIILFADLRNILMDGKSKVLSCPVRWNGTHFLVPREGAELVSTHLGKRVKMTYQESPRPAGVLRRLPLPKRRIFKVVVDPGHGGKDPGAVYGGLKEKTVALDVALRLKRYLKARGVTVVMTRSTDKYVSLSGRVKIANREKPDIFISIHANAEKSLKATGALTLYPPKGRRERKPMLDERAKGEVVKKAISPKTFGAGGHVGRAPMIVVAKVAFESYRWMSIDLADEIQTALARVAGTSSANKGVIEDWRGLRVLSTIHAPAVLVEVDFLSNAYRRRKLATPSYRASLANAVGKAVMRFLERSNSKLSRR